MADVLRLPSVHGPRTDKKESPCAGGFGEEEYSLCVVYQDAQHIQRLGNGFGRTGRRTVEDIVELPLRKCEASDVSLQQSNKRFTRQVRHSAHECFRIAAQCRDRNAKVEFAIAISEAFQHPRSKKPVLPERKMFPPRAASQIGTVCPRMCSKSSGNRSFTELA